MSTLLLSGLIDMLRPVAKRFNELMGPEMQADRPDYLLYSIFGGFFMGLGMGLVCNRARRPAVPILLPGY